MYIKNPKPESEFVRRAVGESRRILTRDGGLEVRWTIPSILYLESDRTYDQHRQVISGLNLPIADDKIFTLYLKCNNLLGEIRKGEMEGRVQPYVYRTQDRFFPARTAGVFAG